MELWGFRISEIAFLSIVLFLPFIVSSTWFFYVFFLGVLCYTAYYVYDKKYGKKIKVTGQGVFITGCDSGFGFGLAKRLDTLGFTVFAGCFLKDGDGAQTLKSSTTGRMFVVLLDVRDDKSVQNAVKVVKETLQKSGKQLWAVINNAGIQVLGEVEFCPVEVYQKVADVNMFGMVRTTKAFLPLLRQSKGRVINVTSVKGRVATPYNAAYGITKYGGETFSDILRLEMRRFGVKVIIIEPGHFGGITGILNSENLSRLKKELDDMWAAADEEVKNTYGEVYFNALYQGTEGCKPESSPTVNPVTDAFVDALTAVNPRYRYLVDGGNGLYDIYCVLARLNSYLPECVMDYLLERYMLSGMPKIRALQK